jgi:uncharacterized protein (DUF342 family)
LERLAGERENLDKLDRYLEKTKGVMAPEKWELLHVSSVENRCANAESFKEFSNEQSNLVYELEHATNGMIHVLNTVFTGSRVLIGPDSYTVNDEINYVSFKHSDDHVVFGPCELSKTS